MPRVAIGALPLSQRKYGRLHTGAALFYSSILIDGDGHSISGAGRFRPFFVEPEGKLKLSTLVLRDGFASGAIKRSG